jgi:hypothetical protein
VSTAGRRGPPGSAKELFVRSAVEHPDGTVTLPLHRGTSHGAAVFYVILDRAATTRRGMGVNPQRQGLNSAILDGLSPLDVLRWKPNQGGYSPLWDGLAEHGLVAAPDGSPFAASGFIVNCPIISQQ